MYVSPFWCYIKLQIGLMGWWIYHFSSSLFPSSSLRPSLLERQASRSLWWTGPPWIMRTWWVLTCLRCLHGISLSVYCAGFVGNGLVLQGQEMLDPCSYYFLRVVFGEMGAGTLTDFYSCGLCCSHCTSGPGITLPGTQGSKMKEKKIDGLHLILALFLYMNIQHAIVRLSVFV